MQRNHTINCLLATLEDQLKISKDNVHAKVNNKSLIDDLIGSMPQPHQTFNANFDSSKLDTRNAMIHRRNDWKNEKFTNDSNNDDLMAGGTPLS